MEGGYIRASLPLVLIIWLATSTTWWCSSGNGSEPSPRCREKERRALLDIKHEFSDPANLLSSWTGEDCCAWRGIACSAKTGHVVRLNLRNPYSDGIYLGGNISSSLLQLSRLTYLDLSKNDFDGVDIPEFLGSLSRLRLLSFAEANFGGMIPPHLGNLTNLRYLDFHGNGRPYRRPFALSLHWLSQLSSLRYLDMSQVNLSEAADWLHTVNNLPNLRVLSLDSTYLNVLPAPLPHVNLSSLATLSLSANDLGPEMPTWLYNISNLQSLNLGSNQLRGPISPALGNMSSLKHLLLQFNEHIQGPVPWAFRNLCNLQTLDLSDNKMDGEVSDTIAALSGCTRYRLETLKFRWNQLTGRLPNVLGEFQMLRTLDLGGNRVSGSIPASIGGLPDLRELYLGGNRLDGPVPASLGQLTELVVLDLGFNSLTGVVSDAHFANLTKLEAIFLSSNAIVLNLSSSFVPRFQLKNIHLGSCQLGRQFPPWLQIQHQFSTLDISNAGISDVMPDWFWGNLSSRVYYLNISSNQISGNLSMLAKFPGISIIDLSHNNLQGPLPPLDEEMRYLYLSHNSFTGSLLPLLNPTTAMFISAISVSSNNLSGSIPSSICDMILLDVLELSDNHLTGEIPGCWSNSSPSLEVLNLARNSLHGTIPGSLGSLSSLQSLHLNENDLHGEIPSSLGQCRQLLVLDLGENTLTGNVPAWIGQHLVKLMLLRLRSNKFHGSIPTELGNLAELQVLDLAHNQLSGSIPWSFANFSAMATENKTSTQPFMFAQSGDTIGYASFGLRPSYIDRTVIAMKGRELEYDKTLFLVTSLDLSSNNLSGHIPEQLSKLIGLRSLNLSGNQLTGNIPDKIGDISELETLDLSRNTLSGGIPSSISSMNSLVHLNLSNNGLSGKIPTGSQLQTLTDPSIYEGNPDLCGPPLQKKCPGDEVPLDVPKAANEDSREGIEISVLYLSMGIGFAVGFWVFLGSLILKKSWQVSYFEFIDDAAYKLGCIFSVRR